MYKRYFVPIKWLKPGMRVDQPIIDRLDRVLVAQYSILDQYVINELARYNFEGAYISEGEIVDKQTVDEPTSAIARNNISKLRTEDPKRVELKESVKKRISQGIQYLYNNSESEEFTEASGNITNDLMRAIQENDAVAFDISALKTSDEYTFKHSVDVATLSMIIAKKMGYDSHEIYNIGIAGLLHDMGKSKVPTEILNKPGRLTDEEFEVMKQHSALGYKILAEKEDIDKNIAMAVLQHHEKMNGKGYPFGVKEDKIHRYAKILSVSDVYDALVTPRPYKEAMSQRTAVEILMTMTEELDINAMRIFMSSVILYPVDSTVMLSNGERARVVRNHPTNALRPTVVGLDSGTVFNLAEDLKCASIVIV